MGFSKRFSTNNFGAHWVMTKNYKWSKKTFDFNYYPKNHKPFIVFFEIVYFIKYNKDWKMVKEVCQKTALSRRFQEVDKKLRKINLGVLTISWFER